MSAGARILHRDAGEVDRRSRWRIIAALALVAVAASPAAARSVITETFVATVGPAVQVLETADAAALSGRHGTRLGAFARRDSEVEAQAVEAVQAWARADAQAAQSAARAPTIDHLGPIFNLLDAGEQPVFGARPTPAEQAALTRLPGLEGEEFDALYVATARPALQRLAATYKDYILNGDDIALRAFAVRTLPKVEALVSALDRI